MNFRVGIMNRGVLFVLIVIAICVTSHKSYSQISKLLEIIEGMPQDTTRVDAINHWIAKNCRGHSEACMPYQEEALALAAKLKYKNGFAWAYFNKGGMYRVAGYTDSAVYYLELSNLLFDSLNQRRNQAPVLNELGIVYRNSGRIQEAIEAHDLSAEYYQQSGDSLRMAMALNNKATAYGRVGADSIETAVRLLALNIAKRKGNKPLEASITHNIANKYYERGDTEKALEFYNELREVYQIANQTAKLAGVQNSITTIYLDQGDYVKALNLQFDNLEILQQFDDVERKANVLLKIGDIYSLINEYDKALAYHLEASVQYDSIKNVRNLAESYVRVADDYLLMDSLSKSLEYAEKADDLVIKDNPCNTVAPMLAMANVYLKLDNRMKAKQYYEVIYNLSGSCATVLDRAKAGIALGKMTISENTSLSKKFLTEAYELSLKANHMGLKKEAAKYLSELYELEGNDSRALQFFKIYHNLNDSLYNQQKLREFSIKEAENKFEKDKRELVFSQEKEKLRLEEEKKLLNLKFIGASVGAFLLLITGVMVFRANRSKTAMNLRLENANNKLRQLDSFKSRLFANINHDIRTPLTLIQGYAIRIESNKDNYLTSASEEDLDLLQRNVLLLTEMTNEIQDLLLLEEQKLKIVYHRVEIQGYVSRMVRMFSSLADLNKTSLTFKSEVPNTLIVHLDERHFEKIFFNLISNAFRYTPSGGEIEVTLQNSPDHVVLIVKDSGKGISKDDLPHIFDRFYQSPMNEYRSKEGFGIGLAVVKELISLHNGQITVESEEGAGTSFIIKLPHNLDKIIEQNTDITPDLVENHPAKSAHDTMVSTVDQDRKTIMVVDDHEEVRNYITSLLKAEYWVKEAADGKQALKILEKNHVDLIITDLMMPWLDGYGFIEKLKESDQLKSIPLMVVSARTTVEDKHKVLDAGINEFISKPFDPAELSKRIRNTLENRESVKRNQWEEVVTDRKTLTEIEQDILKKLNRIIVTNISNPDLSTDLIASELSASRSKAIRLIKNLTDKTPLEYIRSTRLNYVDDLIRKRKVKNATEAALAIGMKHVTHFSKQYKNHFGKPPEFPD